MLPVSVVSAPPPPTFIATPMPDATATYRVAADNVAPSVSSAQLNNNTRGNNTALLAPMPSVPEEAMPAPASSGFFTSTASSPGAQFLAQLIAQDVSPETQGMLMEYEKMVAFSNVKFKPSEAGKPEPAPANVFSRMLQQDKPAAPQPQAPAPQAQAAFQQTVASQAPMPRPTPTMLLRKISAPSKNSGMSAPRASSAYTATVKRNDASAYHHAAADLGQKLHLAI